MHGMYFRGNVSNKGGGCYWRVGFSVLRAWDICVVGMDTVSRFQIFGSDVRVAFNFLC